MKINVVRPPTGALWGKFNDRAINHDWVKRLTASFVENMDSCTDDNSMDVALDPAWLENSGTIVPTVEGLDMEDVPLMAFNAEGAAAIKRNNLWMLSGKHRRLAVMKYIEQLEKELHDANNAIEDIIEEKTDDEADDLFDGVEKRLNDARELVGVLEMKIKKSSFWTVRIFDRGAWGYK